MDNTLNIILVAIIAAILVFAVTAGVKKAKGGCCSGTSSGVRRVKAKNTDKASYGYLNTVKIEGMMCIKCKTRVENAFNRNGYFAKVDLGNKCAKVFSSEPLTNEIVMNLIARDGYVLVDIKQEKL